MLGIFRTISLLLMYISFGFGCSDSRVMYVTGEYETPFSIIYSLSCKTCVVAFMTIWQARYVIGVMRMIRIRPSVVW